MNVWYQCVLCRYRLTEKQWKCAKFDKCPLCGLSLELFKRVEDKIDYSKK